MCFLGTWFKSYRATLGSRGGSGETVAMGPINTPRTHTTQGSSSGMPASGDPVLAQTQGAGDNDAFRRLSSTIPIEDISFAGIGERAERRAVGDRGRREM